MAFNIQIAAISLLTIQTVLASHPLIPRAGHVIHPPHGSGSHALMPRQYESCPSGEVTCGEMYCIPSDYTCCDTGGGCSPGTRCQSGGCCEEGKICDGVGGIDISYQTSTQDSTDYYDSYTTDDTDYTDYTYYYGPTDADVTYTYDSYYDYTSRAKSEATFHTATTDTESRPSPAPGKPVTYAASKSTKSSSGSLCSPPEPTGKPPKPPKLRPSSDTPNYTPTSTTSALEQTASGGAGAVSPLAFSYPLDNMSVASVAAMILALVTGGIAFGI